jgi:uncharacterized lipoprotein YajG
MHLKKWYSAFCALMLIALLNGCSNNSSSFNNTNPQSNSAATSFIEVAACF